ncbi:rhodanese-like domain-containing protein [Cloacibacterium sp.]|uniref:rhodanese-like domain-containing protein n=1 Tax=Cloacibacterium sp. TaxID=1913682 RepID=UPI0039E6CFEE
MTIEEILKSGNYHLIDVRQPEELEMDGKIEGAVNIPLATVPLKVEEIKEIQGPKIIFCRSGGRSGQACQFLTINGLTDIYNGGGYMELQEVLEQVK